MAAVLPWVALAVSAGSAVQQHQEANQAHEDTLKATSEAKARQAKIDADLATATAQNAQAETRDALRNKQKQNMAAAGSLKSSTILTSPLGTSPSTPGTYNGGQKTLLGA